MVLGVVRGAVWGARQASGLEGEKLIEVEVPGGGTKVAIDRLGAGPGDRVILAHGSRVRDLTIGESIPEKDIVIAIVDGTSLDVAQ